MAGHSLRRRHTLLQPPSSPSGSPYHNYLRVLDQQFSQPLHCGILASPAPNTQRRTLCEEIKLHKQSQQNRLGICGTHLKSSIQDIVDEVAPIKKAPYGVEGRFIRM